MKDQEDSRTSQLIRKSRLLLTVMAATTLGIVVFGFNSMHSRTAWPPEFQSNGERIYFMGMSAPGVSARTNGNGGMMGMGMMRVGCADCHGADRLGARLSPRFWLVAPPLTPEALFAAREEDHQDDGHGDHDQYTDETLGRAITRGVDPGGEPLNAAMPRWSMSDRDLGDLIDYLKVKPRNIP